jgi:tRNA pseudouridine38-40 synthase
LSRYKLTIEYEGTRYSGWQAQKNARTVQGELIGAAKKIFNRDDFELMGSGRTDAGVHAIAQVAHLEVQSVLAPNIIRMKLNDELPADLNVLDVVKADARFHARHDAVARSYLYQISTRRSAFGKRFVWWVKDKLDLAEMKKAAGLFEGMHDFRSFTRDDPEEKSTKVLLDEVRIEKVGALILIRITGSHFLWNMVKQMVGVLVEVGRGNFFITDVDRFLRTNTDEARKYTASPSGLFLERVYYKGEEREKGLKPVIEVV